LQRDIEEAHYWETASTVPLMAKIFILATNRNRRGKGDECPVINKAKHENIRIS